MNTLSARIRSAAIIAIALIALAPSADAEPRRRYIPVKRSAVEADAAATNDGRQRQAAGRCTGTATACAFYAQPFCNSQPGCAYSFASNLCTGVARTCASATNETFCEMIKGCLWK